MHKKVVSKSSQLFFTNFTLKQPMTQPSIRNGSSAIKRTWIDGWTDVHTDSKDDEVSTRAKMDGRTDVRTDGWKE